MKTTEKKIITVETTVAAPVEKVWIYWTEPHHIMRWNNASDDWHTPRAENDLRIGGSFHSRMEAKDGSNGFDFNGKYTNIVSHSRIEYVMEDGRHVDIEFQQVNGKTMIKESFEPENEFPLEMQETGWQSILDNFKRYSESLSDKVDLHFEITINANIAKVYNTMIDQKLYSEWTSEFNPTSRFEGSWNKGSKIKFIGESEESGEMGMFSRIVENIPYERIVIEHLGLILNGKEITSGPEVAGWAGAIEEYRFKEIENKTLLAIEMDTIKEYENYMLDTWPKALDKLKEMCESNNH